jgi:hypothetical protein
MALRTRSDFDLVAPIAIYHGCDVCYRKEARAAFKALARRPALLAECGNPGSVEDPADFAGAYNRLLEGIVLGEKAWTTFYDRWGARGFKDEAGQAVFSGDDAGMHGWFDSEAALRERLGMAG